MNEFVVPDYSARVGISFDGEDIDILVNQKYDRIDYAHRWGAYFLKVIDPEYGFMNMIIDEETAFSLQDASGVPIVPRDYLLQSEYELYLSAQAQNLEDLFKEE